MLSRKAATTARISRLIPSLLVAASDSCPPLSSMAGQGIRIVKYYAWEVPFVERISSFRAQEVNKVRSARAPRRTSNGRSVLAVGMLFGLFFFLGLSVCLSVDRYVCILGGQSVRRSACSVGRSLRSLVGRYMRRPVGLFMCLPNVLSISLPLFTSIGLFIGPSVSLWIGGWVGRSLGRSVNRSAFIRLFCPVLSGRCHAGAT